MAKKIELFSMPDSPALATQNDRYQQFFLGNFFVGQNNFDPTKKHDGSHAANNK